MQHHLPWDSGWHAALTGLFWLPAHAAERGGVRGVTSPKRETLAMLAACSAGATEELKHDLKLVFFPILQFNFLFCSLIC